VWRPLLVTTNLVYGSSFLIFLVFYNNYKYKRTFVDFREANVSVQSVDYISVLWRPQGYCPPPPNPALLRMLEA
jgi:hypothetical protein